MAVKPDVVPQALRELSTRVTRHHLIISIAAGVTLQSLQHVRGFLCLKGGTGLRWWWCCIAPLRRSALHFMHAPCNNRRRTNRPIITPPTDHTTPHTPTATPRQRARGACYAQHALPGGRERRGLLPGGALPPRGRGGGEAHLLGGRAGGGGEGEGLERCVRGLWVGGCL